MAHTSRGIWFPELSESVRPTSRDFKDQALTTTAAIDTAVVEAQWFVRSLTRDENLNAVTEEGGYNVPSYSVANSLANRPSQGGAIDRAKLHVYTLVGGEVMQVWSAIRASGQDQITVERRRDTSGTWTPWRRTDNWQEQRPLVTGEDVFALDLPGSYTIRTYAIANSLLNKPAEPLAINGATVVVLPGENGLRTVTWYTTPGSSVDAPIMRAFRDNEGYWSDWRRIDHHVSDSNNSDLTSLATASIAVENTRKILNRILTMDLPETGDIPVWAWSAPTSNEYLVVPTHEGSGSVTHPSIIHVPDGWNGYEYWMAFTPYPTGLERHEDPNIVCSHDGNTWVVPDGLTNPLDDQLGRPNPYNSDTHLTWGPNGEMVCSWRMVDRPNGGQNVIKWSWSTNGSDWTTPVEIFRAPLEAEYSTFVSQAIFWQNDKWRMYGISTRPNPNQLIYFETTELSPTTEDWQNFTVCTTSPVQPSRDWWHFDIQPDPDGGYYGVMADVERRTAGEDGDLYLMRSEDGDSWEISTIPLVPKVGADHDTIYKSTLLAKGTGRSRTYDLWYVGFKRSDRDHRLFRTLAEPVNS